MECHIRDGTIHFEKAGTGAPLLLLHGNGESHEIFDRAVPLLAERFTVYALDTRGHGKSSPVAQFHYRDMAEDVLAFIRAQDLAHPVLYGFSDGGITALLVGLTEPALPACIVGSGVNVSPNGLTPAFLRDTRREWKQTKNPLLELMLHEPHICRHALARIRVPVYLTAGEFDLVLLQHTLRIAQSIPHCTLRIFSGETHDSYVVHSPKIAEYLLDVLPQSF